MTHDGRRYRTPGGVFFHLVRQGLDQREIRAVYGPSQKGRKKRCVKRKQDIMKISDLKISDSPVLEGSIKDYGFCLDFGKLGADIENNIFKVA